MPHSSRLKVAGASRSTTQKYKSPAAAVLACFFSSGLVGLMYQVLWLRMMDHVIGSAPFAVAALLTVFMGGLALGSYLAGKLIDRLESRGKILALYGKIEIAIGLYALLLPFLVAVIKPLFVSAYAHLWPHPWLYSVITFTGCLLLLIVPTTLMGTTLPVLCRYYVTRMETLGTRSGRLYSLNTIGAAVGVLLCSFVLIPRIGISGTLGVAVAINVAIGTACLWLARRATDRPVDSGGTSDVRTNLRLMLQPSEGARTWALTVFAISGFCAMACEVFWTRLIGLIVGPTTYAFSVVVATFIIGLAIGSMLFGWLADRINKDLGLLHVTQLCAALLALGVSQVLGDSQFFFAKLIHTHQHTYGLMLLWQTLLLFSLLLGPTLFWGAAFPLVSRICTRGLPTLGRSIGNAYAVNTIGAIVGAFGAGFVLIPLVGKETGLRLIVMLQWGAAGLGLIVQGSLAARPAPWRRFLVPVTLAGGLVLAAHYPAWRAELLSRGWYRDFAVLQDDLERTGWIDSLLQGKTLLARQRSGQQVVFQSEGAGGFTTVEQDITSLGTVTYALFNSGKADASSHGDLSTQTLSGHLPMLFHPNPQTVMVLGLASGMTAGEVLLYPIAGLDILEINHQVVEACRRFFTPFNRDCLSDPRTRLIIQDGRNHLALTRTRYDVIISEPSNPWMAGLANLYTLDFFRLVRSRLTERGVFAQWIQSYEMDWDTFSLLGRTFAEVFESGALIKVGPGDYLLMGFADGRGLEWDLARDNLAFAQGSSTIVLKDVASLAHLVVTEDLPAMFGPGPLHTDNRPRLEYAAPIHLYTGGLDMDRATEGRRRLGAGTRALLADHNEADALLDLIELGGSVHLPLFSRLDATTLTLAQHARYMDVALSYCSDVLVPSFRIFGDHRTRTACAGLQARLIRRHVDRGQGRAIDYYNLGFALTAAGQLEDAGQAFATALQMDPAHVRARIALGLLRAQEGRLPEAVDYLQRAVALAPRNVEAHRNLGMVAAAAGDLNTAAQALTAALAFAPRDVPALNEMGLVRLRQGRNADARALLDRALGLDPHHAETHHNLGLLCFAENQLEQAIVHFSEALRLNPDNPNVSRNFQAALVMRDRRGRLMESETDLRP